MAKGKKSNKDWRKASKKAMRKATEHEALSRFKTADPVFNYRWEHVKAVVTLARCLADITGADGDVVEAAAWLHDIAKGNGAEHPRLGANFARTFLPKTTFPAHKIERVARAIEDHMGLWRDEPLTGLESQVLWDADKLAKIGLTAAFHWTAMSLAAGRKATTREMIANGRDAGWQRKTVESMHTEAGRRAAEQRLHSFNHLWNTLEAELNGQDLLDLPAPP
jgi:uncharacterized protein